MKFICDPKSGTVCGDSAGLSLGRGGVAALLHQDLAVNDDIGQTREIAGGEGAHGVLSHGAHGGVHNEQVGFLAHSNGAAVQAVVHLGGVAGGHGHGHLRSDVAHRGREGDVPHDAQGDDAGAGTQGSAQFESSA